MVQNNWIKGKIEQISSIIQNTIFFLEEKKHTDLFSNNDTNDSFDTLNQLFERLNNIDTTHSSDENINKLQKIINRLSVVLSNIGSRYISDICSIVFGSDWESTNESVQASKIKLITKYVSPIGYKTTVWDTIKYDKSESLLCCNKMSESIISIDLSAQFECYQIRDPKSFYKSVAGIKTVIHNDKQKKTIILNGIIENIPYEYFINEPYIQNRLAEFKEVIANSPEESERDIMYRILDSFTLKDFLICGKDDLFKRYILIMTDVKYVKKNTFDVILDDFFKMDLALQREMLIHLILYNQDNEVQYIAYLLYDFIQSSDVKPSDTTTSNTTIDNIAQKIVYRSMPWKIKKYFKDTMTFTFQYSQDTIGKYDLSKISLEQRVLLLRAEPVIKDRAIAKLKEIKTRQDDQGGKAKQYLEGLLNIPFGVYKKEPILKKMSLLNESYNAIQNKGELKKTKHTLYEISTQNIEALKNVHSSMILGIKQYIQLLRKTPLFILIQKYLSNNISKMSKNEYIKYIS